MLGRIWSKVVFFERFEEDPFELGDDVGDETTHVEGEREQQEEREKKKSHSSQDLRRSEDVWKLQTPQTLRQQRSPQSPLQRSRLDR